VPLRLFIKFAPDLNSNNGYCSKWHKINRQSSSW
jgi:hypothetical protein